MEKGETWRTRVRKQDISLWIWIKYREKQEDITTEGKIEGKIEKGRTRHTWKDVRGMNKGKLDGHT